jgi:DNA-binding HxlR family transcriptional regulator
MDLCPYLIPPRLGATMGGVTMAGYGQFCPVAKASEIFAERWTPLVLRELLAGSHRFSDLQRGVPLMSRTLLARRLRELEDAGVIERLPRSNSRGAEYYLTPAGQELQRVVENLGEWGQRWARKEVESQHDLDPGLLVWDIHRRLNVNRLPSDRVVIRFDFHGVPRDCRSQKTFWLVLKRPDVDVCLKDPGFEVDLSVSADLRILTRAWLGDIRLTEAMRTGSVIVEGPRKLVEAFPRWLALSGFAGVERPRRMAIS